MWEWYRFQEIACYIGVMSLNAKIELQMQFISEERVFEWQVGFLQKQTPELFCEHMEVRVSGTAGL